VTNEFDFVLEKFLPVLYKRIESYVPGSAPYRP
jgi:hypothetical protein